MPEDKTQTNKISRTFGVSIGVTERIYILGLVFLATGISLVVNVPWALIAIGMVLLITAFRNAAEREKGTS